MIGLLRFPELYRIRSGRMASQTGDNGAFHVRIAPTSSEAMVIASSGDDWEHVSVSLANRIPTWDEMQFIKRMFWPDEACVMQLHPPQSDYINVCNNCLHLWRPLAASIPRPPQYMVG